MFKDVKSLELFWPSEKLPSNSRKPEMKVNDNNKTEKQ